ncbi:MAG: hypothetical protein HPY79_11380 [Bacteroidales bacterium]|nr:hypothetical protein [Bacteroidales bacterium]
MEANYGEKEIISLLKKVRIFNKEIGSFQSFAITENFDYAVKLSNGMIYFKLEDIQDDERDSLTPEQLIAIANRFVSSNSQTTSQEKTFSSLSISSQQTKTPQKQSGIKKTIIIISIVLIVVIVGGITIFSKLYNSNDNSKQEIFEKYNTNDNSSEESYEEKVMTIEEIEYSQPTNFLSADATYRENFWGDKIKVKCSITNNATVATYKDVMIRITYYTKTGTEITSEEHVIYEVFPPNSTKTVELKIDNYAHVNSIDCEVIGASPYELDR